MSTYCNVESEKGLSCAKDNLILLHRLSEDFQDNYISIERAYKCKRCDGIYKYVYHKTYEARNFDAEAGWTISGDHYYKVGEKDRNGIIAFSVNEAQSYGYKGTKLNE